MVLKTLSVISVVLASQLIAAEPQEFGNKWRSAFFSDWLTVGQHYSAWQPQSFDDAVEKQFYIAYVNYRLGDIDEAAKIFDIIDEMVRENIFSPVPKE